MTSDFRDPPRGYPCWQIVLAPENVNFYLYKPCVMCFILLLSRLLQSGSEPRLPLSLWEWARASLWPAGTWESLTSLLLLFNEYTYMQLRSPKGNLSEFSPNIIVESVFGQSGLGSLVHLNFLLKGNLQTSIKHVDKYDLKRMLHFI